MEVMEKTNKTTCRLSVFAAAILVLAGIGLTGYFMSLLPSMSSLPVWQFVLYAVLGILPICIGGAWLTILYRRRLRTSGKNGAMHGIIFGLLLVTVGVLLFCFSAGLIMPQWKGIILSWQKLLIVLGIIEMCKLHGVAGLTLFSVGTFFLIPKIGYKFPYALDIVPDFTARYWPILIVIFGIALILGLIFRNTKLAQNGQCRNDRHSHPKRSRHIRPEDVVQDVSSTDGTINYNLVFTGYEQVFLEPVFRGGKISVSFAGMELDLRKTSLPEGVTYLTVDATFGGVEIKAPDDWNIEIESHSVFGGFRDDRRKYRDAVQQDRRLVIIANCTFGGGNVES